MGLPRGEIPVALFSFNAGIEAGQLAFVMLVCAAGYAMGRWSARIAGRFRTRSQPACAFTLGGHLLLTQRRHLNCLAAAG